MISLCFSPFMTTSQQDTPPVDIITSDPGPSTTTSFKYKCSQCPFQCNDKSSAEDHMMIHRHPFKITITSYGPNQSHLAANVQELDRNMQQEHEIVIRSGFSGGGGMSSDVQSSPPMQYTTLSCQTTPSGSGPRVSVLQSMLTTPIQQLQYPNNSNMSRVHAGAVPRKRMRFSSGVAETGGSSTISWTQRGQFVCQECNARFEKLESYQVHKALYCAPNRNSLLIETSVAVCMAQEPSTFPPFSGTAPSPMPPLFPTGEGITAAGTSTRCPRDVFTCSMCNINFYEYETYVIHKEMYCMSNKTREATLTTQMQSTTESDCSKTYTCMLCKFKSDAMVQMRLHACSHQFEGETAVEAYLFTFVVEEPAARPTRQSNYRYVSDWRDLISTLSVQDLFSYKMYLASQRKRPPTDQQTPQPSTSRSEASDDFLLSTDKSFDKSPSAVEPSNEDEPLSGDD